MPSQYANYSGNTGHRYRLYIDYDEDTLNENNNTSRVVATIRMATTNNYGWYDSTNQTGYLIIDGTRWNFNSNYPSSGTITWTTQSKTVTHNSNGQKTVRIQGYHNANQGSGLGSASLDFNFVLTDFYEEIAFNSITFTEITDVSFKVNVSVNRTADLLQLSLNGGAWTTYHSGNFTSKTVQVGSNINPVQGGDMTVKVRVRRDSNGNITDSGTYTVGVVQSNRFFDAIEF